MFEKLSDEKRKLIEEKLESYNLENENTDQEIKDMIFNTVEYKKYIELENPVDENDIYIKKSKALENYLNFKKK